MDVALALLRRISALRTWRCTARSRSRSPVADRDCHALVANVRAAGPDARALSHVGRCR